MSEKAEFRELGRLKSGHDSPGPVVAEELSPEEDRRILHRIDKWLLPVMALSYMFQFLDKSALAFTAIMDLPKDLHLAGTDFSWASGIYYIGYLVASYPAGVLMVRWRVAKTIAVSVILWGGVLMLASVTTNAASLLAVRFFLGVAEAPIAPGLTVVVSMWYKRSEQPLRHAAWFLGNTTAGIIGGLAAYGIGHIQGIAPWKAVFLIFGGATVAWSVGIFWLLPDVPMSARFLTKADRAKAVTRVKDNMTGIKSDEFKWAQCREALLDVKTWLIVIIKLCGNIPNGGVQSFGSLVIQGLGFGRFTTLLLQSASFLVQLVMVLICTYGSARFRNTRTYFMTLCFALAMVGSSIVRQRPPSERWTRYAGYCIAMAFSANFPLILSMLSGNFGGFTKKVTVNAIVFMAYCAGNIVGPQLFLAREAPTYTSGFLSMMICFSIGFLTCIVLRLYLWRENKRRDRVQGAPGANPIEGDLMVNLMDKTDKEIPQFRYVY
ncbi:hypothetical protein HIM_05416 [Hirsutella minnesotensis 3608]|uniref:Major facilitator superfamily (MFS) profile domain-containing protein n=1 Tax=Hirsutella minnesotensis 3608 TaxID=1043627 RepID=A0A0F8A0C4_9HYPO|nr:hypothetical protein HIM_05416 [Hirsutella minnesotensis 3608]